MDLKNTKELIKEIPVIWEKSKLLLELIALQQEFYSQRRYHNLFNNCEDCKEVKRRINEIRGKLRRG